MDAGHDSDDLETLRRWESAGGSWYVASRTHDEVTVSLCRCDGGEEAERLVSRDQVLVRYAASRASSEAAEPSDRDG